LERRTDERPAEEPVGPAGPIGEESGGGRDTADARFDFGRVWRVAACALLAAAAVLLFLRRFEAAFFVAGLGAAAWFLNVRTALIRKHDLVKVGGRDWRPRREVEEAAEEDIEE
jgi:hypothetical protein